ncbi:MAG: cyclophilin-like fold protein [Parasutterella sp.]
MFCCCLCFLSLFLRRTLRSARVVRQRACNTKFSWNGSAKRGSDQGNCGSREFRVVLNSTPEAKLFYSQLPLSVSMGRFGGREFYGSMPGKMKVSSEGQYTFKDGTLTYCPTNHTVAFFYAQTSRPNLTMAVYPMGSVLGNLNIFHEMDDSVTFHFSK